MADAEPCICPGCTRAEEWVKAHPAEAVALLIEAGALQVIEWRCPTDGRLYASYRCGTTHHTPAGFRLVEHPQESS